MFETTQEEISLSKISEERFVTKDPSHAQGAIDVFESSYYIYIVMTSGVCSGLTSSASPGN